MRALHPPASRAARVLVVTVNYRTPDLAIRCLASLEGERRSVLELRAVVVDNASGDGSMERLRAALVERGWSNWVRLIESPVNGGFGAGNNLALREALASPAPPDHVLLLNPDAAVDPGAVAALVDFLAEHPKAGIAGPATEVGRGNLRGSAFRFPGILNSLDEGLHFGPLTRLLARCQLAPPPRVEAHPTDWVSGGCMLIRVGLLREVGLFDEGYFLYFEEVDLCLRAARAGWQSWYVPAARILHDAGASTGASAGRELERRMPAYWFESRRRYFLRNRGRLVCLLADLAWVGGNALWCLRRRLSGAPRKEPIGFFLDFVRYNLLGAELRGVASAPRRAPIAPAGGPSPEPSGPEKQPPRRAGTRAPIDPSSLREMPRPAASAFLLSLSDLGVVVIARNEGDRLQACLDSLRGQAAAIVYADSASSDGSVERVRARGIEVVALEGRPLNAARGRNAGLRRLLELRPELCYVFFVDGDCLVAPGFLAAARAVLENEPELGAVCGRRRELAPEVSFYRRVVDSEWNTPVGETRAFGGDVLVRVGAMRPSGGYDERLNQGEDPELAFRLVRAGWRLRRIEHEMTEHDVGLQSFTAWRRRHERGGYAYAHGAALHWGEPGRYNQRELLSVGVWGLLLPCLALALLWPTGGWSLALLAGHGVLVWRIRRYRLARGDERAHATRYGLLIALGKSIEAIGALRCAWALATGRQTITLEYKGSRSDGRVREAA